VRPLRAAVPTPPALSQVSLLDRELPLSWRLRLFIWFVARKLARVVLGRGRSPDAAGNIPG